MTTATDRNRQQALEGLTDRATRHGWTTVVHSFENPFNVIFFRDLPNGMRELLFVRLSATGQITRAERNLGTKTHLAMRETFRRDKRHFVQLAMSAEALA